MLSKIVHTQSNVRAIRVQKITLSANLLHKNGTVDVQVKRCGGAVTLATRKADCVMIVYDPRRTFQNQFFRDDMDLNVAVQTFAKEPENVAVQTIAKEPFRNANVVKTANIAGRIPYRLIKRWT